MIQTAPSPRAGIGECFGLEPGHPLTFQMNTALRRCGFDRVFDTNFAADLTIIEEGVELLLRLYRRSGREGSGGRPAAIHQLLAGLGEVPRALLSPSTSRNLSTAKSPQQMFGALIKTYYAELNGLDPAEHRHRGPDALLGQEVRVQPAGDVRTAATRTSTTASPRGNWPR